MTNMFGNNDQVVDLNAIKEKYSNDPEKAWEALAHSQKHIGTLEAERQRDREELAKKATLEEVLTKIKESTTTPSNLGTTNTNTGNVLDDNTLSQKIKEAIAKEEAEKYRKASIDTVRSKMVEKFGDKARDTMVAKANELGVTTDYLDQLASNSPKAFFTLFGIDGQQTNVIPSVTRGTMNVSSINTPIKEKDDMAPYREMLKTDKTKYFSQGVQNEIMRKAMENAKAKGLI